MTPEQQKRMDARWWYINGVAYDFTPFVRNHPGGIHAIFLGKGQECESLLNSYHMTMPPQALLDKYKLPEAQQPDPAVWKKFAPSQKFTFNKGDFFDTVKEEVKEYFKSTGKSHKADGVHVAMFFLNVALIFWSMFGVCHDASYVKAFLHAVLRAILVVQTTHGASHFAFSLNPMVNRWAYRVGTILIGLWSPKTWDTQHVVAHHVYTNEWPYDSDSGFPIKSILYNQRRLWYHKYQHIYMWVVYAMFIPIIMLNSIREMATGKQTTFRLRYHHAGAREEAWGCTFLGAIYILLPYAFLPFWTALPLVVFMSVVSSLIFSLQFVVNHEVDTLISDKPHAPTIDFGQFQLEEAFTFAPESLLATEFAGGLNTQIEHHLFPGVHYSHYRALSKIIRRNAAKFGLNYQYSDTWAGAIRKHYNLLKNPPASIKVPRSKQAKAAAAASSDAAVVDKTQ